MIGCGPDLLHSRVLRSVQIACRSQPATVIAAFEGIQDAMGQCADRMRFQQWDCSNVGHIMHDPPILKYGRCSFSVQHGITASRKLLTKTPVIRSPLRSVEKHNLKAGRLAVKKTLIASCKCHGVSGSCQQKTCWKKTATLDHITDYLVEKYARAKLVTSDQKAKNADLVYLEPSPDPCQEQISGRVCAWRNETHTQGDCVRLCCGKGFKVRTKVQTRFFDANHNRLYFQITHEVIHYKCDCKFVWCCKLICKDCLQHRWVSTCN
ncbi:wnt family protein [Ancylostoma ceylanicum]|uniref:Protein Wnt n=1 Tax=Ancylostoma ceylanicum TaxID=53326 RepID=A0A0D6LX32_9BILA|nr:wnt family protein [Ancylostoma ceylanicum]